MTPRGRSNASAAFTSGTTKGTSASIRKALELSIITAPYLVIVFSNSLDGPALKRTAPFFREKYGLSSAPVRVHFFATGVDYIA